MADALITVSEARARVLRAVSPLAAEELRIADALGRVLASDVVAADDVPPFASSAMDGYAVIAGDGGPALTVVGESRAGAPAQLALRSGQAIRISTGAVVPEGATAIVPQENVSVSERGTRIEIPGGVVAGDHIRLPGEDMRRGVQVLSAGTRLGPVELGAVVAAGAGDVIVARRPRVSVLCTGDELRAPGERLRPGEIHNSNAPMLTALAQRAGALSAPAERLPDDREATQTALSAALDRSDVVLISGGVSVGPHDHVKPALLTLGVQELFWGVALQPGKPTWFGIRDGVYVFGLPGNPVSAVVTFSLFARPALAALADERIERRIETEAALGVPVRRNPRREQALRVRLERRGGQTLAFGNGPQGSHILSSLTGAHALAMIPPGPGEAEAGSVVALEELAY
jgi:molybdopterin molybdotransferase